MPLPFEYSKYCQGRNGASVGQNTPHRKDERDIT